MAIKIPKAITLTFFITLINHLKFIAIGALTHLGLFKPPPEDDDDFYNNNNNNSRENNYILILDGSSPSLVPIPVHVVTASIKLRLPVLPYSRLTQSDDDNNLCTVCLDCIHPADEIRELFNCSHVFHRLCLDTWVDEGQVTCPLCRSMLLPPRNIPFRPCAVAAADPVDW
ncbi:hypothetical protein LguiB_034915 [Lonicera macranthoides]